MKNLSILGEIKADKADKVINRNFSIFGDLKTNDDVIPIQIIEFLPEEALAQIYKVSYDLNRLSEREYKSRQSGVRFYQNYNSRGFSAPATVREYSQIMAAINRLAENNVVIKSVVASMGIPRLVSMFDVVVKRVKYSLQEKKRWGKNYPPDLAVEDNWISQLHQLFRLPDPRVRPTTDEDRLTVLINQIFYQEIVKNRDVSVLGISFGPEDPDSHQLARVKP